MPVATPVTTPVDEPIVAVPVALLDHAPNPVASVRSVVVPTQPVVGPAIADGFGLTVTGTVTKQPVPKE